jgi:regulatory protein
MPECIVELKPRPRERVTVTLSGGRFFTIPAEQAVGLDVGVELDAAAVARLDRIDQYFRGREKIMRLIALRARTRTEVRGILDRMEIDVPVRDGLIAELEELGLVDDERFARDFVRVKADARSMGPHRLRHDLRKKGVRRDIVDAAIGEEIDAERQEAMARELAERKVGRGPVDERVVRRVAGMLKRRGYDYEVVNRIAYELLQRAGVQAEDLDT